MIFLGLHRQWALSVLHCYSHWLALASSKILNPAEVSHFPEEHNTLKGVEPLISFIFVSRKHLPTVSNCCPPNDLINMLVGSTWAFNSFVKRMDIILHSAPVSSLKITGMLLTIKSDWMFLLVLPSISSMYSPSNGSSSSFTSISTWLTLLSSVPFLGLRQHRA